MIESLGLLLLVVAIGVGSIGFAMRPLWRRGPARPDLLAARDGVLAEQRESALAAIAELDRDYRVGNLVESDYQGLRQELEARAIGLLKAEDEQARTVDAAIEEAVAHLRDRRGEAATAPVRASERPPDGTACRRCGRRLGPDDRFCSGCGTAVTASPPPTRPAAGGTDRAADRPAPVSSVPAPALVSSPVPAQQRRAALWLGGGAALAVGLVAGVLWLALNAPSRTAQQPLATLPSATVRALAVDPSDPRRLVAGTAGGVVASEDGGRTWQPLGAEGEVTSLVVPAARPETVYLAGRDLSTGQGQAPLAWSDDRGRSWQPLDGPASGPVQALAADLADPPGLYAVADGGLFRSSNGGDSWSVVGAGLPADTTALAITPAGPDHPPMLFMATAGNGILSSMDGGVRWGNASGFVNGALPTRRVLALVHDPNSGDSYQGPSGTRFRGALYAGTDRGLFKSIDAGTSWNRLPLDAAVAAVAVDPTDSRVLLAVDARSRLFRSADRGLTWPGEAAR